MLSTVNRWFEQNRWAGDAVIAGTLLVILGVTSVTSGIGGRDGLILIFTLLLVLPLFARRTYPLAVLWITVGLCLLQVAATASLAPGDLVVPIVIHAAAAYIPDRRWGFAALAAGVAGAALAAVLWSGVYYRRDPGQVLTMFLAGVAVVGVAYLMGLRRRERHERAGEQLRALAERNRLLTTERDTRVEMGAAAERARIARELHDIVAHSLSVIVVQADGGAAAARTRPDLGPQVLETIAATSRDALAQMRRMVSVLRGGNDAGSADYLPAPGPDDVDDLVAQVHAAGLPVTVERIGTPREMTDDAGLAVYRVVQESLTNVLKHAGPAASCRVVLHYGPAEALITVTDDGRGAAAAFAAGDGNSGDANSGDGAFGDGAFGDGAFGDGAFGDGAAGRGHGLEGMRERVELLGGTVHAGPKIGGGFEVSATIPYRQNGPL